MNEDRVRSGRENGSVRYDQQAWKKILIERDGNMCEICGSTKNIQAHHIEHVVCNPIESLDIDNGILLCKECHNRAHKQKGCRSGDLWVI